MIPFAVPRDNFLLNLQSVSTVTTRPPGTNGNKDLTIDVKLIDGRLLIFEGKEAEIVTAEIAFCLNMHRAMQQQATGNGPSIITPTNGKVIL